METCSRADSKAFLSLVFMAYESTEITKLCSFHESPRLLATAGQNEAAQNSRLRADKIPLPSPESISFSNKPKEL